MANDRDILLEIWNSKLPICFKLFDEEINDLQTPEPYYLMVPRLSYFPLVTEKVKKHFSKYVHADYQEKEVWLSFNEIPLKWHYPIGLLFDMNKSNIQLPWTLTVHFSNFPTNELLYYKDKSMFETHFMASLKEADVLKHHKNQIVSKMQKKDHTQLLLGLQNNKFDQFWAINRKLMDLGGEESFKYIPVRFYRNKDPLIQKLVKPLSDTGEQKTLEHMLKEVYPDHDIDSWKVVIHGIEPPHETPLQWLSEHLSYADNFLHLHVVCDN